MKRLVFHREAEEEYAKAIAYYEGCRQGLGQDFQDEVERGTTRIARNPFECPRYKETSFRKCVLRRFPYSVFYLDRDETVWIAAVAHQKRRPDYWLKRKPE